jgi:hypothetical protein
MSRQFLSRICRCLLTITIAFAQCDALLADDQPSAKQSEPRDPAEISRDETALVRQASKKVDEAQRVKAIVSLCELFVEIGEHPEVEKSVTLQRVSVELQTRLRGIEDRLTSELRRQNIPEPKSMIDAERVKRKSRASQPSWRMLPASEPTLAASPTASELDTSITASSDGSSSYSSTESGANAAGSPPNQTGLAGPGGMDDIGWWLVDLIRHTVQPDYWDTAGGPGTVVYYGPSRALVIRGSWRVHEEVADLLSALR